MSPVQSFLSLTGIISTVVATGQFTNPSDNDYFPSFQEGLTYNISWTGTEDYDELSLGFGAFNDREETQAWPSSLISTAKNHPTFYIWTIDLAQYDLDAGQWEYFYFYIYNGNDGDDYFKSTSFLIGKDASKTISTPENSTLVAAGNSPTSISNPDTSTSSPSESLSTPISGSTSTSAASSTSGQAVDGVGSSANTPSDDGLSTATKAGIALGVLVFIAAILCIILFFINRKKRQRKSQVLATADAHALGPYEKPELDSSTTAMIAPRPLSSGKASHPSVSVHEVSGGQPHVANLQFGAPLTNHAGGYHQQQAHTELPLTSERHIELPSKVERPVELPAEFPAAK